MWAGQGCAVLVGEGANGWAVTSSLIITGSRGHRSIFGTLTEGFPKLP